MAKSVNLYQAKTHLSALVEEAAQGEEIVIAKAGKPVARLVALQQSARKSKRRLLGRNVLGVTQVAPDFDDPLPEDLFNASIDPV
ncbi:MAG: type II toxin-antitoxin system Phd/YefM family antitoxin [Acidobacteriaceae bacterium]